MPSDMKNRLNACVFFFEIRSTSSPTAASGSLNPVIPCGRSQRSMRSLTLARSRSVVIVSPSRSGPNSPRPENHRMLIVSFSLTRLGSFALSAARSWTRSDDIDPEQSITATWLRLTGVGLTILSTRESQAVEVDGGRGADLSAYRDRGGRTGRARGGSGRRRDGGRGWRGDGLLPGHVVGLAFLAGREVGRETSIDAGRPWTVDPSTTGQCRLYDTCTRHANEKSSVRLARRRLVRLGGPCGSGRLHCVPSSATRSPRRRAFPLAYVRRTL